MLIVKYLNTFSSEPVFGSQFRGGPTLSHDQQQLWQFSDELFLDDLSVSVWGWLLLDFQMDEGLVTVETEQA